MNKALTVIFFEDYFVCSIQPNESAWEPIRLNASENILLYFYVTGNKVRNDEFAKERFEANDANAFGNFYELILSKEMRFTKYSAELTPIHLLDDVLEQVKSAYLERMSAFSNVKESNHGIPVNLCFIPGISVKAQALITEYFIDAEFNLNYQADYYDSILRILERKGIIPNKVNLSFVESSFGDLHFHYIEYDDKIKKNVPEILVGRGVDHCIGNLARLFVEKTARKCFSRLLNDNALLDKEIKNFHRRAAEEIKNFVHGELVVAIELSDFSSGRIAIDQSELEKMSSEPFQFIKFKFETFISKHSNLARTEKIILNGKVLASEEFVGFFSRTYGTNKVVKPFADFTELLSRGVVAAAPKMEEQQAPPKEIEIKITVTTTPSIPVVVNSAPPPIPPLPQNQRPPLPPIITPGNPVQTGGSSHSSTNIKINTPPIPPVISKPETNTKVSAAIQITVPPIPPLASGKVANISPGGRKIVEAPPLPVPSNKPSADKGKKVSANGQRPNQTQATKKGKKK